MSEPFRHYDVNERMVEQDGKLIVRRHQNVQSLLDDNRELSTTAPSAHGDAKFRLAGRIPLVIAEQWAAECGEAIGTQAFAQYVRRKLADGDFAKFRVKGF
jgi:phosphoenolpyruvate carboxylase